MPNWFYFTVNVSGEKKDVEQFMENVKGSERFQTEGYEFDMNHFIPQPDNIFRGNLGSAEKDMCKEKGIPNWYDWNIDNWGTKWNAQWEDTEKYFVDGFPSELTYHLRTAWAFPEPVIKKMISMYPDLDFHITGEEESGEYGVYVSSSEDEWIEEEPVYVDEETGREVYWESYDDSWHYMDDDSLVPDSDTLYAVRKFSWS